MERATRARGLEIEWSEIIGLVPERVALGVAERRLKLRDTLAEHVLERRLLEARASGISLRDYVAAVGTGDPFPGGGSVAAIVGALSAALAQMVASLTLGRERYAGVATEMTALAGAARADAEALEKLARADSEAYARVTDARRLPHSTAAEKAARAEAIESALLDAARVPLEVARISARTAGYARDLASRGNSNAVSDAGVAALLAVAACRGADYNVRINVKSLADPASGAAMASESAETRETGSGGFRTRAGAR